MTSTLNPETLSGERIEELQQIAGDHMFMHAAQINDWRGNLKVYVKGQGVWVETADGQRHLDAMAGLWYKSAGYGRTEIADAVYAQMTAIDSPLPGRRQYLRSNSPERLQSCTRITEHVRSS